METTVGPVLRPAQLRVRVEAADDLTRLGLAAVLGAGCAAVDAATDEPADLVVLALAPEPGGGAAELARRRGACPVPLVVVVAVAAADELELLRGTDGPFGYLTRRSATAQELPRVARRVAAGGSYVDEDGMELLLRSRIPRQPPSQAALSAREAEVLAQVADGWSNAEIARRLCLSRRTVEKHVGAVYAALGLAEDPRRDARVYAALVARTG